MSIFIWLLDFGILFSFPTGLFFDFSLLEEFNKLDDSFSLLIDLFLLAEADETLILRLFFLFDLFDSKYKELWFYINFHLNFI